MRARGMPRLVAALAARQRRLRELELVEQAERVVRAAMNDLLHDHLAAALGELQVAAAGAAAARACGDLVGVVGAQLRLSDAQDLADGALLHHLHESEDAQQEEAAYWVAKHHAQQRIDVIRLAINLRRSRPAPHIAPRQSRRRR